MPFSRAMFAEAGFASGLEHIAAAYDEDPDRAAVLVPDAMLDVLTVAGDADAARRRIDRYRAMGVTLPVAAPAPAGMDRAASGRAAIDLATNPLTGATDCGQRR